MQTDYAVRNLVRFMVRKYGITDAITLMRTQYQYIVDNRQGYTVFEDANPRSRFFGTKYTYGKRS